jgi:PrtD family type I secretion system ABC transporter
MLLFTLAMVNEILTRPLLIAAGNTSIAALARAESSVRNGDVVEAMGMMPNLLARWRLQNDEAITLQAEAGFRNHSITAASRFLRQFLQVGMLGIGAWLVILGELTPGAMIAGSILMSRALAPVEQAISSWRSALGAREAFARLQETAANMPVRAKSMPLPAPQGNLSVEGVTYMHPGHTEAILKNIRFTLPAGMAMGVIGPSGAGKTTLIRLLLGNLSPRLGHVRLDAMDVSQWDADDLGRHCGYLPQDIELFSGSIAENIARMGECDAEKVIQAATLAGCHDMILRLPKGYDTQTGAGGLSLSGGERQRIALARALYGSPRYIILDEPNASLDAVGEAALINAIKTLKAQGATLVIIGHRPGIIQHVDNLLVLNKGQVQDFGPKEKVLATLSGNAYVQDIKAVKSSSQTDSTGRHDH